ncbi:MULTISPECIES: hypothetical protein [Streptosporangium]|uniref:Uncharacterized protein n=1 Tax=Streptosporangium brasiliense TaxID=47480 RepID=A0ABT9QW15_9ACTN|nr:hypothetical protein [Streptosporangium brasiliense]MDP9861162.1 hypothetical protein [Streptosporangium brasiliense]
MHGKRRLLLMGPALLGALALGPAVPSQAMAVPGPVQPAGTGTMVNLTTVLTSTSEKPGKRYRAGRRDGFADGRGDCKAGRPHDLNISGSGNYARGFRDGYNEGYHSCTQPKPKPSTTTTTTPPGGGGGGGSGGPGGGSGGGSGGSGGAGGGGGSGGSGGAGGGGGGSGGGSGGSGTR